MNDKDSAKYAAFILRVGLGIMFIAHGLLKVLVLTMPTTMQYFESFGFPGWLAYPVAIFEIGGGVFLIAGIATRIVSVLFMPILLGALSVHAGNGWVFASANGGWEYVAFLIVAVIVQALLGNGAFALRRRSAGNRIAE
jgi:putative oxidoreductase